MGSKTISVRDETYRRLDREKREGESFSDVIDRLVADDEENPLRELVGFVDVDDVDDVRQGAAAFRADVDERFGGTDRPGTDEES